MLNKIPWSSIIELLFTVGIGFYVEQILQKPDLAFIVWFVGALLFLHRILFNVYADKKNEELLLELENFQRLFKIIDLDIKTQVNEIDKIRKLYISILEPEFREIKNNIILTASEKLENLLYNKETEELSSSSYYDWIFKVFNKTIKGDSIKAVSVMHSLEWDINDPNEVKFFNANIQASKRGVMLERVFLMKKTLLNSALENEFIKSQEKGNKYKIKGYFSDIDLISKIDSNLLRDIGHGFIIVNDKVVLVDVFSEDGIARGNVIMKEATVNFYIKIFNRLKNSSTSLEKSD